MVLTQWPPKNGHFEDGWFYICITIGEPLSRELRPYRHQDLLNQLEHEDWESYIPDNPWEYMGMLFKTKCRDEFSGQLGLVEGISKSRTLMFSEYWHVGAHWLREEEVEYDSDGNGLSVPCALGEENEVTRRGGAPASEENEVAMVGDAGAMNKEDNKKQHQAYLAAPNPKKKKTYTRAQVQKFEGERDIRLAEGERNREIYERRIMEDSDFAKAEEERKELQNERKKTLALVKKERNELTKLFGLVFGEEKHNRYEEKWKLHKQMTGSDYMAVGNGKFFRMNPIRMMGRDDLYTYTEEDDKYVPIIACDILNSGEPRFAFNRRLPSYDKFDTWYRDLPMHIDLVTEEDKREMHYMAPKDEQYHWPFVYIYWSDDDDDSSDASHQYDVKGSESEEKGSSDDEEGVSEEEEGDEDEDNDEEEEEEDGQDAESDEDEEEGEEDDEDSESDAEGEVYVRKKSGSSNRKVVDWDSDSE